MPHVICPSLDDGIILLRRWRETDADGQLAAFQDAVFVRFSDWAPTTRAEVVERIAAVEREREAGNSIHLAITDMHRPDSLLGEVSLSGIDRDQQRASVGYWLTPAARGRGHASRAVKLIARWAFADLALARLELTCGPDNVGSQRVALRCGFRLEGRLRSHLRFKDGRRDSLVFGLLPQELAP